MFQSPRDFSIEIGWNRDIPQSLTFHGWSSAFCWPGKAYFEISNETMKFVFPEPGPLEGVKSRSKVILRRWAEGWMGFRKIFFVLLLWPKLLLFYILLLRLQKITKIIWKFMPVLKAFFVLKLQRAGSTVEFELRRDNLTAFSCGVLQSKHRFQDPTKTRCCYLRSPQPQSPNPRAPSPEPSPKRQPRHEQRELHLPHQGQADHHGRQPHRVAGEPCGGDRRQRCGEVHRHQGWGEGGLDGWMGYHERSGEVRSFFFFKRVTCNYLYIILYHTISYYIILSLFWAI